MGNHASDTPDYLAVGSSIDRQIEEMDAACRFVQARRKSRKRAFLCFDEWNVWYKNMQMNGEGKVAPHLIEEVYNLEDALVVASFLHSFIRHADCVKIANLAQIVNVIAPVLTQGDEMLVQSIFYPFEMFSKRRQGVALKGAVEGPTYEGKTNGRVAFADTSVIMDGQRLQVFVTNRSPDQSLDLTVQPADLSLVGVESAELLTGPEAKAANTYGQPDVVRSQRYGEIMIKGGKALCQLPPLSFLAATLTIG